MGRYAVMLLWLLGAAPALAGGRGPVCREPSVVDEMTHEVRAESYYNDVDPRLVIEQPTTDPQVVRCDVCVLSAPYDTIRFGNRPVGRCMVRHFEVLTLSYGFVVRAVR